MKPRPKILITLTPRDRAISLTSSVIFAATWIIAFMTITRLPDQVPVHFNAMNQADGYAGKASIFLIPVLATFVFVLLAMVGSKPEALNYPVTITNENACYQYHLATRVLLVIRLVTMLVFAAIELQTINPGFHSAVGAWLLPLAVAAIFAPVSYLVVKSARKK